METSPAISPNGRLSNYNRGGVPDSTLLPWDLQVPPLFVRNGRFGSRKQIASQESQCRVDKSQVDITSKPFSHQTALQWLLTQKHASAFAELRHSTSSENSGKQNPTGQAVRRRILIHCGIMRNHWLLHQAAASWTASMVANVYTG